MRLRPIKRRWVQDACQVAYRPKKSVKPPTENQSAQRLVFAKAIAYAKGAMSDPVLRPVYDRASLVKKQNAFSLAVGDYFKPPEVRDMAADAVEVKSVGVIVHQSDGTILEQGATVFLHGRWIYTLTTAIAAGTNLIFEVTATDWPGNKGANNKLYP